ncbi:unnamed protein product [Macrosiphum euphorbiae]|uniref:Uncharacterized protein n=1 Tax=Macrosiphum euphorbiae TaxID=13131 RepID=A0AAV0XS84_9HEMI|nr:unnamed protein product [Macrosiphum euphorbiae]
MVYDNLQEQDDDSSYDDLHTDPNWKSKSVFNINSDDDDIVIGTPSKVDEVKDLYSPEQNWKISTHIVDTPEQCNKKIVSHTPATDKWTVDKTFETTYNEEPPVKRVLFKDVEDSYKKPGY